MQKVLHNIYLWIITIEGTALYYAVKSLESGNSIKVLKDSHVPINLLI